jgi:hypothetical protein
VEYCEEEEEEEEEEEKTICGVYYYDKPCQILMNKINITRMEVFHETNKA